MGRPTMSKTYFPPLRRTPANGVAPRPVPGPLAPERCVEYQPGVGGSTVTLIGKDREGTVRIRVELATDDASAWWLKVIRHWLAWAYSAGEIKIVS